MTDETNPHLWKAIFAVSGLGLTWLWSRISGAHKRINSLERETMLRKEVTDFVDRAVKPIQESVARIETNVREINNRELDKTN